MNLEDIGLSEYQKDEIIKYLSMEAARKLYAAFKICGLQNEIKTICNEEDEYFELTFKKIEKP